MPKTLADGKTKFTLLTEEPADPEQPTAAELNAGIDASFKVTQNGFSWTPTDSETVQEGAIGEESAPEVLGRSLYTCAFSVWREYLQAGGVDPDGDAVFAAVKVKGSTLWGYARKTEKPADEDWAAGDEIMLGAEFNTDHPKDPGAGGWLKFDIRCLVQRGYPWTAVKAGA